MMKQMQSNLGDKSADRILVSSLHKRWAVFYDLDGMSIVSSCADIPCRCYKKLNLTNVLNLI